MAYDVFISYRRATGVDDARLLQQALKARGYDVFFDYASLRDGRFNEKIFESIDSAPVFILMMTEHSLDKCAAEGDWVRMEIERAIGTGRKIILVAPTSQKWSFPDNLPDSLRNISDEQVSPMDKASLFEESIDKIINERFPDELKRKRRSSQNTPCTVTNPSNVFFGRDAELASLHELLAAGKVPVVTGPGGTGKSELVFQYAKRYSADYPGGLFQIDMETVKSWDEAFQRLLSSPGANIRSLLDLSRNSDDTGTETRRKEISAAEIVGHIKRRAGQAGQVLLVMDNVESPKTLFAESILAKLSLLPDVSIVATARVCDANLRLTDSAVEFRLEDLSPDAALAILLADRPEADAEERKAAGRVAELLGYRALYLRRVPALIGDLYAQTVCDSYAELAKSLEENLLATVAEETEGTHLPEVLWNMTRERLLKVPLGAECVKLAHVASFFSPDGFPQHILKHLWKTVVVPNLDEKKFTRALDILKHHNIFQSLDCVRIHRLDRAAIMQTAKEEPGLEEAVGKSLASYEGMSPESWLLLVDNLVILRCIPNAVKLWKDELNISLLAKILCLNVAFQDECDLETLDGEDWALVLSEQPHLAERCPWEKMDGWNLGMLILQQPQFLDRCPLEKLDGWAWAGLLANQPELSDRCPWEKLICLDWADLLRKRPQFAEHCPWDELDGMNWAHLLCERPEFADNCPWEMLNGMNWAVLLGAKPQFSDCCAWEKLDGVNWVMLLSAQPKFADCCPWEKLGDEDWMTLLFNQPKFADRCPWGKLELGGVNWVHLLCYRPQFAVRCPWEKLGGRDWATLLGDQPQFSERCPWEELDGWAWVMLLDKQPHLFVRCPLAILEGKHWARLLGTQPQFSYCCSWEKLESNDWARLLCKQPQFSERCPWEEFDDGTWLELLIQQPQFADRCPLDKMGGAFWMHLLCQWPQFEVRCQFEKLDTEEWLDLITRQPQFLDRCPWEKLQEQDFRYLYDYWLENPERCLREKLGEKFWTRALAVLPQFVDYKLWGSDCMQVKGKGRAVG